VTKAALSRPLLRQLCAALAACFFPRHAPLLIHHCFDSLGQTHLAQSSHKQLAVLTLLHSMFVVLVEDLVPPSTPSLLTPPLQQPGLTTSIPHSSASSLQPHAHSHHPSIPPQASSQQHHHARTASGGTVTGLSGISGFVPGVLDRLPLLGPAAVGLLSSPALLAPLTERATGQGPLAAAAGETLSAIVAYTAAWQQAMGGSGGDGAGGGGAGAEAVSLGGNWQSGVGGERGAGGGGGGGEAGNTPVLRTLFPATVSTAAAVRRVIDTLASSSRRSRRVARLLPHLHTAATTGAGVDDGGAGSGLAG
jgi:hypothetical protein